MSDCGHGNGAGGFYGGANFEGRPLNAQIIADFQEKMAIGIVTKEPQSFNREGGFQALQGGGHIVAGATTMNAFGDDLCQGFFFGPVFNPEVVVHTPGPAAQYSTSFHGAAGSSTIKRGPLWNGPRLFATGLLLQAALADRRTAFE
jgi:hypothetical protein